MGVARLSFLALLIGVQLVSVCSTNHPHDHNSPMTFKVFMHMKDLRKGKTMPLYLATEDFSRTQFLSREEANSIPFSSRYLPEIHKLFAGSPMASFIEATIVACEGPPLEGETKFCATSLESMLDFVLRVFGIPVFSDDHPTLLTTKFLSDNRETYQNYTVLETPKEIPAEKMVGCHTLAYPYTVAYCHSQESGNKVYNMLLRGENGDLVNMYVACHLDTWQWDPKTPAFTALGTHPGTPVCHVFPPHGNFLWIYNSPRNAAAI